MFSNLEGSLINFANETIRLSRRNLNLTGFARKGRKINNSKDLSKGLGYKLKINADSFELVFTSKEEYANFIDQGVNGLEVSHNAPFSFKKKFVNIKAIQKYVESSKIKLRRTYINDAGQKVSEFVPKNRKNIKAAAFAMARSIAKNGIKPTEFFQEAFEEASKELKTNSENALKEDLEQMLVDSLGSNDTIKITQR